MKQKILINKTTLFTVMFFILVMICSSAFAQSITITGNVTDEEGNPLPGVTVVVQGTTTGTVTDVDGNYSLANVREDRTLIFSFVGMVTRHIAIEGRTTINLQMEPEAVGLEEIVVVGYGTQRRENLTGSVSMATSERLENRPVASTGHGLQGVIPNLNITFADGDPMTRANYNIRGFESITGGSPLILVDGVPMSPDMINPNDIESVNVLKDAGAAAIYGARAAFGVILIQTKTGREGLNVTFNTEQARSVPILHVDLLSDSYLFAQEYNRRYQDVYGRDWQSELNMEYFKAYHDNPVPENEWRVIDGRLNFYGNNNLREYMITDAAPQQKYDLSVSGATDRTNYYVSLGHMNKKGYLKRDDVNLDYNRYNILMRAEFDVIDWLSLDSKIVLNAEINDEPHYYHGDRHLNTIVRFRPMQRLKFPDLPYYLEPGDREDWEQYIGMYFTSGRAAPFMHNGGRHLTDTYDTWLTQGATITPIEGLRISGDFSYRIYERNQEWQQSRVPMVNNDLLNFQISYGQSANDYMQNRNDYNRYYVLNTYAEYTIDQFDDHYFRLMSGFNQEEGRNQMMQARGNSLVVPDIRDIRATIGDQFAWGSKNHNALRGAFYRFNYRYQNKYLFETNARYDLTSRFPKKDRAGFFPSFSAGWRISHEPFMEFANNWMDNLMLRGSYGSLGNQQVSTYAYIPSMSMGTRAHIFDSGVIPYVGPAGLVSDALTWETVTTQNIGVDLTILNQRLEFLFDTYIRQTKDMLMRKSYPAVLGTGAPQANAADLETRGWEANVIWRDRIGQDWIYSINLALSDNQTEITKYENPTGDISDYYEGQMIGEIWGYETVGIFQTDEEVAAAADQSFLGSAWRAGDVQYADLNGDGAINPGSNTLDDPGDRVIIGNSSPRYSFGINPDISYKNWTLSLFFQGLFRDEMPTRSAHRAFWPWNSDIIENWWLEESWSPDNPDAYWPGPRFRRIEDNTKNFHPQTRYLQDASYIRLKNMTLNYRFPHSLVGRAGLSSASVYFSGHNVWEFTNMRKPLDPEYTTTTQIYYLQRTFALGLRVGF